MSLFQSSVQKQYRALQDSKVIKQQFKKFQKYFHDAERQKNISSSKEEQFQEGFLRELFVDVLGYTINPNKNFNLTTEFKNLSNAQKADGAILSNGNAVAVIELKGTKTKDLESVRKQAFDYKANHTHCSYVITSNFETLRFYIDNAVAYEEFNLFTLTEDEFSLLWLCLARENILSDLPRKIKNESLINEEKITKTLYADYSLFKRELFRDLVKQNVNNPVFREILATDELEQGNRSFKRTLFKKSQKLIDRFLFIFFAEDRGLIPSNTTVEILARWEKLKEMDAEEPLYSGFKKFFNYLDTGRKETNTAKEIFSYNGGLFKPDPILDSLLIDDDLLSRHTRNLSRYDYESQVSVNILGHIFENSLNEIESINAEIDGIQFDKQKTKRKTDGVFYTPPYITKYIVDNTVGRLCEEKKEQIGIVEDEFFKDRKGRRKETIDRLRGQLTEYRAWLLDLTICDPACGSGAFLNEALDFLIREHDYIDMLEAKLLERGQSMQLLLSNIENTILEKNIYGVDINEESVEIAKLSLWLRSAQPRRKLNDLNNNIKCGNSLIDSKSVAGDKAFKWNEEFPEVFAKGGFDIVIGNPPYGIFIDPVEEQYFKERYPLSRYKMNLYTLFIERMFKIFNQGHFHFIIPKSLVSNTYFEDLRRFLLEGSRVHELFMISEKIFEDAEVGGSLIIRFEINNEDNSKKTIRVISTDTIENFENNKCLLESIPQEYFLSVPYCEIAPVQKGAISILDKLRPLKTISDYYTLKNGLNPGNVKNAIISCEKITHKHKPIIWGKDISRYSITWSGEYVNYDENLINILTINDIKSKDGMKPQDKVDFALRTPDMFEVEKIVIRKTGDRLIAAKDINNLYFDTLVHGIYQKSEMYSLDYLLAILNSRPATLLYRLLHDIKGKVFAKISLDKLGMFPIVFNSNYNEIFSSKNDVLEHRTKDLSIRVSRFAKRLNSSFSLEKTTQKLENFYLYDFKTFLSELKKQKITLSLVQQDEWEEYFDSYKNEIGKIVEEINEVNDEIDKKVYELYGLTDEEIKIIESSI